MGNEAVNFSVPEADFDLSLLPEGARQRGSQLFQEAVTRYYKDAYREAGGRVDVAFTDSQIEVGWQPQADQVPSSAEIAKHLAAGRMEEAIPLLRMKLQLEPNDVETLYNLGMVCSDRQQLSEARELLQRAVDLDPAFANAHVALGVAALRADDPEAALAPLERAVVIEPTNPFALRTLGQAHLFRSDPSAALPHLRQAAKVAPGDPIALFTLAQCLLALEDEGQNQEITNLLDRALSLAPTGELAERIKGESRKLASRVLRGNVQGQPRMDVVMYCSAALEAYAPLKPAQRIALLQEVAAVGQRGLSINDPDQKVRLKLYKGGITVSALQAACILFVGVKLCLPGQDSGLDFDREYEMAQAMVEIPGDQGI